MQPMARRHKTKRARMIDAGIYFLVVSGLFYAIFWQISEIAK
jgi:hypothetical protein